MHQAEALSVNSVCPGLSIVIVTTATILTIPSHLYLDFVLHDVIGVEKVRYPCNVHSYN